MKLVFLSGLLVALSAQAETYTTVQISDGVTNLSNALPANSATCQKINDDFMKCQFVSNNLKPTGIEYVLDSQYTYDTQAIQDAFVSDCNTISENNKAMYSLLSPYAYKAHKAKRTKGRKGHKSTSIQVAMPMDLLTINFFVDGEIKVLKFESTQLMQHLDVYHQLLKSAITVDLLKNQKQNILSCQEAPHLPYLHVNNPEENRNFPLCTAVRTISSTIYQNSKGSTIPGQPIVRNEIHVFKDGELGGSNEFEHGDFFAGEATTFKGSQPVAPSPSITDYGAIDQKYGKYLNVSNDIQKMCPSNLYIYNVKTVMDSVN